MGEVRRTVVEGSDRLYQSEQLALNRALALAGVVTTLTIPLAFYARVTAPDPVNVPLISPDGRAYYLASLLLVGLAAVLIQRLETDDPARMVNRYGERVYQFRQPAPGTAWMVPAAGLLTVYFFLALHHHLLVVLIAPFLAGGLALAARLARFRVMRNPSHALSLASAAHQALIVAVALAAFVVVYTFRARTLYAGPALFLLSFLLLMSAFDGLTASAGRRMLYAAVGGLAVAQLVWGLNYWNTTGLIGGALLATAFVFYASVGRAELGGGVTQRQVVERAALTAPLFAVLAYFAD